MSRNQQLIKNEPEEPLQDSNKYSNFLQMLTEIIAWFAIVISLSFFTGIIGFICYLLIAGKLGFIIATVIGSAGIIMSVFYACRNWKTKGTVNFICNSFCKNNEV